MEDEELSLPATDDVKNFSYTIIDEEVYLRENSVLIKQNISDKNKVKIKDYLDVMKRSVDHNIEVENGVSSHSLLNY